MTHRNKRNRKGTVVTEFALVAPIFFMFLMGAFEFARFNVLRHTADNAAYEAARAAMVPGATANDAIEKANRLLNAVGTRGARITVSPAVLGPSVKKISVTVEIPLNENGWVAPRFSANNLLTRTATLRTERVADP